MIESNLSKKQIEFLERILPNYCRFSLRNGGSFIDKEEEYRLWAWNKGEFCFEYFFTNPFTTLKEAKKAIRHLILFANKRKNDD